MNFFSVRYAGCRLIVRYLFEQSSFYNIQILSLWNRQRNVSCKWKQNSFPLSIDFDHLPKILSTMLIFKSYQIHRNLNKKISIDIKSSCKRLINQDVLHWSKLRVFRNHNNVSSVKTWHKNQQKDLTLLQYAYE